MVKIFIEFLMFGLMGCGVEVSFTCFDEWRKGKKNNVRDHDVTMGYAHPAYVLSHGSVLLLFTFFPSVLAMNPFLKIFFFWAYALVIESIQNRSLKMLFGKFPSEIGYGKSPNAIFGKFVCWDLSLGFAAVGFWYQSVYFAIHDLPLHW